MSEAVVKLFQVQGKVKDYYLGILKKYLSYIEQPKISEEAFEDIVTEIEVESLKVAKR